MTVLLEGIALAGRAYALDRLPGLEPCRCNNIYYMTPEKPNCLVDIFDVWDEKCRAMDALESQILFIGELTSDEKKAQYEKFIPGLKGLQSPLEQGIKMKRLMDTAYHLYQGSTGHNEVFLSESYRKEGMFVLDQLF